MNRINEWSNKKTFNVPIEEPINMKHIVSEIESMKYAIENLENIVKVSSLTVCQSVNEIDYSKRLDDIEARLNKGLLDISKQLAIKFDSEVVEQEEVKENDEKFKEQIDLIKAVGGVEIPVNDNSDKKYLKMNILEPYKDEIIKLYSVECHTASHIASLYDCNAQTVINFLRKHNVYVGLNMQPYSVFVLEKHLDDIKDLYYNKYWGSANIGKKYNCDANNVLRLLRDNGCVTRNHEEAWIAKKEYKKQLALASN